MTPADVTGLTADNGVTEISGGSLHACALLSSGGLKCWGWNQFGQLGDNTTTDQHSPVDVQNLTGRVIQIASGNSHSCALTSTGAVLCWGNNYDGQLGDGTTVDHHTPAAVSGSIPYSIAANSFSIGAIHACMVTSANAAECWGGNTSSQVGDGTTTERHSPAAVNGLSNGVSSITANGTHSCALTNTGGVKCWGNNHSGELGDGTAITRSTPVDVIGLPGPMKAVVAGSWNSCALTNNGGTYCWGSNMLGGLGNGTTTNSSAPVKVNILTAGVSLLSGGEYHMCALAGTGQVWCWGAGMNGEMGNGANGIQTTPVMVSLPSVVFVSSGRNHNCALLWTGKVKCWGKNDSGQLGDGTLTNHNVPVDVVGLPWNIVAIAAGRAHTCALTSTGVVMCWGDNTYGQLGVGDNQPWNRPMNLYALKTGAAAIYAGGDETCAVMLGGHIFCWGRNANGQLGVGSTTDSSVPAGIR
jgi:alpha-tubulin suppressor-like RCC1 family protein